MAADKHQVSEAKTKRGAMRADDAKKLPLDQILLGLGHSPVKSTKGGKELWYRSPFREDKDASLHISHVYHARLGWIWVWKDFGDVGGNVIDFAIRYFGLAADDVSGALRRLDGLGSAGGRVAVPSPAPSPLRAAKTAPHPFTDVQVTPLQSTALLNYIAGRGIDPALAQRYLKEVQYHFEGQAFMALAFGNDAGGYEMRSTGTFKGVLPPKAITLLHPEKLIKGGALAVFEGFTDYLSALTYYGKTEADTPVLILNSVAMESAAVKRIQSLNVERLHLYLDRDDAGRKLLDSLREQLPELEILDQSRLYQGFKDFNAFLMARQKEMSR